MKFLQDGSNIDREVYEASVDGLRNDLIEAQLELLERRDAAVVVIISGMDFPGRSAVAKRLMGWMDPRHIRLYAPFQVRQEDASHPKMWRFWRALPSRGRVGLFLNSWYEGPVSDYLNGHLNKSQFQAKIESILRFERLLSEEGVLFAKFLFYRPKRENLENLEDVMNEKITSWKLSDEEYRIARRLLNQYDHVVGILEATATQTSTPHAPWIPILSTDPRYRDMQVSKALIGVLRKRSASPLTTDTVEKATDAPTGDQALDALETLDLGKSVEQQEYRKRLKALQRRVGALTVSDRFEGRGIVAVFEGIDAAGKGGCIRRLVAALDPRMIHLVPVSKPTDEERAHPYLWRFWKQIPERGRIAIFDRSWYGRVLVERVENYCSRSDWQRAYHEIRDFEEELVDHGLVVLKFWLAIDRDEQLRRFRSRMETLYKRFKITEDDWHNREKWDEYHCAVNDMVDRTSSAHAPWTLVAANDKQSARIMVLQTVARRLEEEL